MHLKSISLKGFKSFPDRTRLEFGPGVSVVVGPNGSGKSNITDAVLWALGEQSPVAVRGSSMQDVIFAGAPGRRAAAGAEVELLLDDSEGQLGLGLPEISIVRRLDRNGEGEYRLAGARCRLVDVIEVLSDTGLGKEMHSVVSQGRVESLVTSKPRDRRLLIEEAAGLGKHRKRRRRAQLKLERTQRNLDRALDVEREARSHLRPLKRQAEAAELHARLERQALEARWELAADDLRARREELSAAQSAVDDARVRRGEVERELEAVAKRRDAAEDALAARSERREELSRRCFQAQSAAERISYRADAARAASASIDSRLAHARELLESMRADAAEDSADREAPTRIAALEQSLAELERDRQAEASRQVADLELQRADAERALGECEASLQQALATRAEAERAAERARTELRDAEQALESARREAAAVGGELASVNQFLRASARVPGAAAALADGLDVEPGYELALAAALDGRLRAAVAADRDQAARLLDKAGADGGRVLVTGADGEPPAGSPVPGGERLADRVRGDGAEALLTRALLRDAWVVDSLDQLADSFAGVAVTRGGRVWSSWTRELRQAAADGDERLLAERNRRERLIRESERAVQAELDARAALERASAAAAERDADREHTRAAHRAAGDARDEAAEAERKVRAAIERRRAAPAEGAQAERHAQLSAELQAERAMLARAEHDRRERERRLAAVAAAIARDEAAAPGIMRAIRALNEAADAIRSEQKRFERELAADREAGELVAAELRECAQREAGLQTRLHAENETLTEAEVAAQRSRDRAAEAEAELGALAARLELRPEAAAERLDGEQRDALTERIERLARRREQLGPVNPLAQQEYAEAVDHVEELERQREDLETALRELDKLIAETDREIRECFEQTFAAAAANFEELAQRLFPGGRGRLSLVSDREAPARVLGGDTSASDGDGPEGELPEYEDEQLGVEIEITPAGKAMKRLSLLSGGEKAMTALAFLFAVFLARPCPFYVLDEVEAALDDLNIDRFLELLRAYSDRAQFIVVTHQKRTMEAADCLYGVSMGADGISKVISRRLAVEQPAA
jgi:chromosome segregation protein